MDRARARDRRSPPRIGESVRERATKDLSLRFEAGERVFTESSHKYTPEGVVAMGERAGLSLGRQWVDRDAGFATTLFVAR